MAGDNDAAVRWAAEKTRLFPNVSFIVSDASIAYSLSDRPEEAVRLAEDGVRLEPRGPLPLLILSQAYARAGRTGEAHAALTEAEHSDTYVCPYETAATYVALGDLDRALDLLLNRAVALRSNCLIWTRQDPRLLPLHGDPRFAELLKVVGLDDASIRTYGR